MLYGHLPLTKLPIKLEKEIEDPLEFYSCCGHNMETPRRKIGKTS
jgi:hypothetical protein